MQYPKTNDLNLNEDQQIEQLIETSTTKFNDDQRALQPVFYLKKLFSLVDNSKLDKTKFKELILKSQSSIDNTEETVEQFALYLLDLITYLQPFKVQNVKRLKLDKITPVEPSKQITIFRKSSDETVNIDVQPTVSKEVVGSDQDVEQEADDDDTLVINRKEQQALKNIQKLDQFCQKLNAEIIKFEKAELTIEELDSEQSQYLNEEKLKTRFNKAYNKLVSLMKKYPHLVEVDKMPKLNRKTDRSFRKLIDFKATRYPEVNKKVEEKLNKVKMFPDFLEVTEWITEANEEFQLNLSQEKIENLAKESFEEIGRHLKRTRYTDMIRIQNSRILSVEPEAIDNETNVFHNVDPALNNPDIDKMLNENKKIAEEKHDKILEEFSKKQANDEDTSDEEDDDDDEEEEEEDGDDDLDGEISVDEEDEQIEQATAETSTETSHYEANEERIEKLETSIEETNNKVEKRLSIQQNNIEQLVQSVLKTKTNNKRDSGELEQDLTVNKKVKLETKTFRSSPKIISSKSLSNKKKLNADDSPCIIID